MRHFTPSLHQVNLWLILLLSLSWRSPTMQSATNTHEAMTKGCKEKLCERVCFGTLYNNASYVQNDPNTHMICNISSVPEQSKMIRCESALTLNNTATFLYTYLGGAHSLDVYVRLQSKVHSWGELGDAQLFRGELHRCHLLAVVGWHNVLKQDQHSVGVVGSQKIQAGAPLEHKAKCFQSELLFLTSFHLCLTNLHVLSWHGRSAVPAAERRCLLFLWVSAASTEPWDLLCPRLPAPSSTLLCVHGWCPLPRFLQHYAKGGFKFSAQ